MSKTPKIKAIVAKIDTDKISNYCQEYPKSHTLRRIIRKSKRVLDSSDEEEVFKLGTDLAYNLDAICDANKTGCVKDEMEKKHWLEISRELFESTIGIKKTT